MEIINKQSLIQQVQGTGNKLRRYLNCSELNHILETSMTRESSDLETIAKNLALGDPQKVTTKDLLLYSQILEALRYASEEIKTVSKKTIEDWASKIKIASQNLGSVDYMLSLNKEEKKKEEKSKMEGIEENNRKEDNYLNALSKKRRQTEDTMIVDTVVNQGLEQTESLDTKRYQVISQQSGPI